MIEAAYDAIARSLNRAVWIITSADGEQRSGLLANWVIPTSIDPSRPQLQLGLAPHHFTTELIARSGGFVAHLPNSTQAELALPFATSSGRDRDKLAGLACQFLPGAGPRIESCAVWLACRVESMLDVGDRHLIWGKVIAGASPAGAFVPLTEQALFSAATEENRQQWRQSRERDIAIQRPAFESWQERARRGSARMEMREC